MSTPAKWSEPEECKGIGCGFNVSFTGNWTYRTRSAAIQAVISVGTKFAETIGGTAESAFNAVYYSGLTLAWVSSYVYQGETYTSGAVTRSATLIEVASLSTAIGNRTYDMAMTSARNTIVHELGHAFAHLWKNDDKSGPYGTNNAIPVAYLNNDGFYPSPDAASRTWRQHPCTAGQDNCPHDTFADQFLGWTFGKWDNDPFGVGDWRNNYMTVNMAEWIPAATKR